MSKPKYERLVVDGRIITGRNRIHPDFVKRQSANPKSPNSIPYHHWDFLVGWIPSQIREGNPLDRRTLANLCDVQERTVALQKWLHAIHDYWEGQFEWEIDPNYNAKRGAKIKRLVPKGR